MKGEGPAIKGFWGRVGPESLPDHIIHRLMRRLINAAVGKTIGDKRSFLGCGAARAMSCSRGKHFTVHWAPNWSEGRGPLEFQ